MQSSPEPFGEITLPGSFFELRTEVVRDVPMTVWAKAPATLIDVLRRGLDWPDRHLFVHEGRIVTYGEHLADAARFANALIRDFGIQRGDRVAIAMRNVPEWSVAFWGILAAGAVAVPLNAFLLGGELAYCLEDSGASVLVADRERIERLGPGIAAARHVISPDGGGGAMPMSAILERNSSTLPQVEIHPGDMATVFYTSGTTGKPKGAAGDHRAACQNIVSVCLLDALGWLATHDDLDGLEISPPGQTALLVVPLFHVAGCHGVLVSAMFAGRRVVLMPKWVASEAIELVRACSITHLTGVPSQYVELANLLEQMPAGRRPDTPRILAMGAAPPPQDLGDRLKRLFPNAEVMAGYGQSECTQIATLIWGREYFTHPKSCGHPLPIVEARILAEGSMLDLDRAEGQVGELLLRGPIVANGYLNLPEATEATFWDGWLHTGDLVRVDPSGLTIVDRAKDMVIRGGENIYCIEVEQALYSHPDVVEAAVVGRAHPILGEEPVACVHLRPAAQTSPQLLQEHVRRQVARFKVPAEIHVSQTPLPRNANGKILKAPLRALFAQP